MLLFSLPNINVSNDNKSDVIGFGHIIIIPFSEKLKGSKCPF